MTIRLLFFLTFFFFFHGGIIHLANGIRGSHVPFLPGFQGNLPFHLETGYVGVGEGEDVQLFYYFVKSASDPQNDPLVLWLTGGPGCSSLFAFAFELGPMRFEPDDDDDDDGSLPRVTIDPYSFTRVANMLFLDLPVGTGFSYARTPQAAISTGLQSCHQAYEFLQKWLVDYPEFLSNPFYVGGDSWAGMIVLVIVQLISNGNEMGIKPQINIKGYLLGNPLTFPEEYNYRIPYVRGMGLISDELYKSLKRNCKGKYFNVNITNKLCRQNLDTYDQLVDGLDPENILEPDCGYNFSKVGRLSTWSQERRRFLDEKQKDRLSDDPFYLFTCQVEIDTISGRWANDPAVQKALHIQPGSIRTWTWCNRSLPYTDYMWDTTPYHANLSAKGYRSLIYSGDHDLVIPFLSTEAWIKSLNYPIVDEWRQWRVRNQVAGYTRTYANNMTFATVKGGGHAAPQYKPIECLAMFERWLSYQPL